jgi:hypothetical protein
LHSAGFLITSVFSFLSLFFSGLSTSVCLRSPWLVKHSMGPQNKTNRLPNLFFCLYRSSLPTHCGICITRLLGMLASSRDGKRGRPLIQNNPLVRPCSFSFFFFFSSFFLSSFGPNAATCSRPSRRSNICRQGRVEVLGSDGWELHITLRRSSLQTRPGLGIGWMLGLAKGRKGGGRGREVSRTTRHGIVEKFKWKGADDLSW